MHAGKSKKGDFIDLLSKQVACSFLCRETQKKSDFID
jgi:hypothetical protein